MSWLLSVSVSYSRIQDRLVRPCLVTVKQVHSAAASGEQIRLSGYGLEREDLLGRNVTACFPTQWRRKGRGFSFIFNQMRQASELVLCHSSRDFNICGDGNVPLQLRWTLATCVYQRLEIQLVKLRRYIFNSI